MYNFLAKNFKNYEFFISSITKYNVDLEGFTTDNENCRTGPTENQFTKKQLEQRTVALPVCSITEMPQELKNPEEFSNQPWVPKTFVAEFTYDYQLTAKKTLTIKQ